MYDVVEFNFVFINALFFEKYIILIENIIWYQNILRFQHVYNSFKCIKLFKNDKTHIYQLNIYWINMFYINVDIIIAQILKFCEILIENASSISSDFMNFNTRYNA